MTFIQKLKSSSEYKLYAVLAIAAICAVAFALNHVNQKKLEKNIAQINKAQADESAPSNLPKIETFTEDVSAPQRSQMYEHQPEPPPAQQSAPPPIEVFTSNEEPVGDIYAPTGRLIECQLVNGIESKNLATPVIGLVTRDYWHNGICIIKAGTEILGTATGTASYDRIITAPEHRFVWRNYPEKESGWELPIRGKILNRELQDGILASADPDLKLTDGTAGLRGKVMENKDNQLLYLVFAKAIQGFGSGISEKVTTNSGSGTFTSSSGSLQTAGGQAIEQSSQIYSHQLIMDLQRQAVFVRVPGGKYFYFYNDEPIDLSKAKSVGGGFQGSIQGLNKPVTQ